MRFIGPGQPIPAADLIILPGSKNTRADLAWLLEQGWSEALNKHLRYGGKVIGMCGGYQMLGRTVTDFSGIEGAPGTSQGLGLLPIDTELAREKRLAQVEGQCAFAPAPVSGYEIHMGTTSGSALDNPAFHIGGRPEGARSADDQILGTYLHGVFDTPQAFTALLQWAGLANAAPVDLAQLREHSLDRIADAAIPLLVALMKVAGRTGAVR